MRPTTGDGVLGRVASRLGGAVVRARTLEGGYGGAAVYRVRLRLAGSVEREVVLKVGPLQGLPVVPDDAFLDAEFIEAPETQGKR